MMASMAFTLILLICLPIADALSTAELNAIQDLAKAISNPEWDLNSNPCSWAGITCNGNNNITGIFVTNKNYEGSIPSSIGNLSALTDLELYNNKLTGSIPASIGRLVMLKILGFGTNELSGSIPPQIGSLTKLQQLYLDNNQLSGTIPSSIANLSSLRELSLTTNSLSGAIPPEIGSMKSLSKLWLQSNQLSGPVPQSFSDLPSLSELMLSYNSFSGNISFIQTLQTLQRLRLNRNNFSGSIPTLNLPNLTECDLGFNQLDGNIPASLATSNLETLFLGHNRLQGSIPEAFRNLKSLVRLDVSHNSLSGSTSHVSYISEKDLAFNYFKDLTGVLDLNCDASSAKQDVCFPSATGSEGAFRLNAGGSEISFNGENFAADYTADASTGLHQIGKTSWVLEISGLQGDTSSSTSNTASGGNLQTSNQNGVYATSKWSSNYLAYHGTKLTNGNYTVTLYFVDIVASKNGRVFDVIVQRKKVLQDFDIRATAGTSDYSYTINASVTNGTLSIELIASRYSYYYTIGTAPVISGISVIPTNPSKKKSSRWIIIVGITVGLVVMFLLLALAACLILVRKRRRSRSFDSHSEFLTEPETTTTMEKISKIGPILYTYQQLMAATSNFDEKFLLGKGGYGSVYKGTLPNGNLVAVKQLIRKNSKSMQTFKKEIAILSMLQHRNLVGINGYCLESEHFLLVCEYMENGNLEHALFEGPGLDWQTRMRIAIGAASGLQYLHEDSKYHVIHCDVKPANILLDKDMNACVADFGLAKFFRDKISKTVQDRAGTIGYMAPEYIYENKLSEKIDVYSFGVVLLELLSGKHPLGHVCESWLEDSDSSTSLVDQAQALAYSNSSRLLQLMDENLGDQFDKKEALDVISVALLCTQEDPNARPRMRDVWLMLCKTIIIPPLPNELKAR